MSAAANERYAHNLLRPRDAQGRFGPGAVSTLEGYNLKPRSRGGVCCRECANEYNRAYQRRLRDA